MDNKEKNYILHNSHKGKCTRRDDRDKRTVEATDDGSIGEVHGFEVFVKRSVQGLRSMDGESATSKTKNMVRAQCCGGQEKAQSALAASVIVRDQPAQAHLPGWGIYRSSWKTFPLNRRKDSQPP